MHGVVTTVLKALQANLLRNTYFGTPMLSSNPGIRWLLRPDAATCHLLLWGIHNPAVASTFISDIAHNHAASLGWKPSQEVGAASRAIIGDCLRGVHHIATGDTLVP